MTRMQQLTRIIQRAIDLHVHIGPEIIPRAYTAAQLAAAQQGRLAGAVTKNHCYPTVFATNEAAGSEFLLIPGLVLNNFVGGLNPDAVYATSLLAQGPFVVWLPTMHAEQFLSESEYEIAPEWVKDKQIRLRKAKDVRPVAVSKNGALVPAARKVIDAVAKTSAVLATGHISWQESELVAAYAQKAGVRAVIITHPIYQHIKMPAAVQQRLAKSGCYMEQCYSMYMLDKIPLADIAAEITAVGTANVVLSSDVGQAFSPAPDVALTEFCELLMGQGVTLDDLEVMLVTNPRRILGISEKTTYNKE